MPNSHLPVVVILAAGAGRRFQAEGGAGSKLDALLLGRTVLEWTLAAVRSSGLPWVVVERPLRDADHLGMGDSIARGIAKSPQASGWLILPGDMPMIESRTLQQVARALQAHALTQPNTVVRPVLAVDGELQPGHPVGFGWAWRSALLELQGDAGAIALVRRAAWRGWLQRLVCQDMGCVYDVDRPSDIDFAASRLSHSRNFTFEAEFTAASDPLSDPPPD